MAVSAFYLPASERGNREVSQINITPLVDVMLVLLVIFMVAAPAMTGRLDLGLSHPARTTPTNPPPRAELHVLSDGGYRLDGQLLGKAQLPAALQALAQDNARTVLQISVEGEADYQGFASALSEAEAQGLDNIALK